jgi:hypothetical protein
MAATLDPQPLPGGESMRDRHLVLLVVVCAILYHAGCHIPGFILGAVADRTFRQYEWWGEMIEKGRREAPQIVEVEIISFRSYPPPCLEPLCSAACPRGNEGFFSDPPRLRPVVFEPASHMEARRWRERLLLRFPTRDPPSSYSYLLSADCPVEGEGRDPPFGLVH